MLFFVLTLIYYSGFWNARSVTVLVLDGYKVQSTVQYPYTATTEHGGSSY